MIRLHHTPTKNVLTGVGTALVACKRLGRHFIGIEKNPEYAEMAKKRIKQAEKEMKKDLLSYET